MTQPEDLCRFVKSAVEVAKQLRQGHALGGKPVDCGAMCMPGLAEKVAELVEEAVQKGAQVISPHSISPTCRVRTWPSLSLTSRAYCSHVQIKPCGQD